jgi:hypothetical protein
MGLQEDLDGIALQAARFAVEGEALAAVLAAEPLAGERGYVCCFARGEQRSWLVLDGAGEPLESRARVREAVAIAAMCELAAENAGGGHLDELRRQLVSVRLLENPPGIDEADAAIGVLEAAVGSPPRLATPAYLDQVGSAARGLERALGDGGGPSPFAAAMQAGVSVIEELTAEVLATYKGPLRAERS